MTKNEYTAAIALGSCVLLALGRIAYELEALFPGILLSGLTRFVLFCIVLALIIVLARCIVNIFKLGSDHED